MMWTLTKHLVAACLAIAVAGATDDRYAVTLPSDIKFEFLGVTANPTAKDRWHALDGAAIEHPDSPFDREELGMGEATHAVLFRKTGAELSCRATMQGGKVVTQYVLDGGPNEAYWLIPFKPEPGRDSVDLELTVADGEWQTVCDVKNQPGQDLGSFETPQGGVALTRVMEHPRGGSMVYVVREVSEQGWRICAVEENGQLRPCININTHQVGKMVTTVVQFDLAPEQIASVVVQTRPFNRKLTVRQIALDPAHPTKPQIAVADIAPREKR
jgi:hypothetical protein